jgi:hypothetical protein
VSERFWLISNAKIVVFLLPSRFKKNKNKNLFFWGRDWKVALK